MKWLLYLLPFVGLVVGQRNGIRMPAEWEPHERTFLCFPASVEIWSRQLLPEVRKDVAAIAKKIAKFEPVVVFVDPTQIKIAERLLDDDRIEIVPLILDDLWARDILPVFVEETRNGQTELVATIFNFNGWGRKQYHRNDAKVAGKVASMYGMRQRIADIVGEGGSFETDGRGTLLVTESSLVNTNRNFQSKQEIERELKEVLGMRKVIWFKGVKKLDITDAHVDCLVRFVGPNTVILNRAFPGSKPDAFSRSSDEAFAVLSKTKDADGNSFRIIELFEPDPDKIIYKGNESTFLSSYVNFLVGNGFVLLPAFGDREADLAAKLVLGDAFPGREIVSVQISALASGGGGIHCATHEQPKV